MGFSRWEKGMMALTLSLAVAGCHPHVELNAPPVSAPGPERVEAFKQLRSTSMHETHTTYVNQYGAVSGASRSVDYAQLADGTRVYHAIDLQPVVAPESPSATAIHASEKARRKGNGLATAAYVTLFAGTAITLSSLATIGSDTFETTGMGLLIGGTVVTLGSMIPGFMAGAQRRKSMDEKATAFELYNGGLAAHLNVCLDEEVLVPCENKVGDGATAPTTGPETRVAIPGSPTTVPGGVAGFEFAMTRAQAQSACEGAGHSWRSAGSTSTCSDQVRSVGLPGAVQLTTCGSGFCEIEVAAEAPEASVLSEATSLKEALESSYGPPVTSKTVVPPECQETFVACVEAKKAHVFYEWKFEKGASIRLRVGVGSDPKTKPDHWIRLTYSRPESAARAL